MSSVRSSIVYLVSAEPVINACATIMTYRRDRRFATTHCALKLQDHALIAIALVRMDDLVEAFNDLLAGVLHDHGVRAVREDRQQHRTEHEVKPRELFAPLFQIASRRAGIPKIK